MANIFDANESIAQYLTQCDKSKELSDSQVEYFKEYGADYMQYLFKLEETLEWAARPITETCLDAIRDIELVCMYFNKIYSTFIGFLLLIH